MEKFTTNAVPIQTGINEKDRADIAPERVNGCETHLFTSLTSKWV